MRLGVISDTHITAQSKGLPLEVLEAFKNVDMVIHAGDIVDLAVLEELKASCAQVRAVWGNMDPYEVRAVFPEKEIIEIQGHRIGIMHGWGHPKGLIEVISEAFKDDQVEMIIFGHSHSAVNKKSGGIIFFNPGSPTDKLFADYNSYGIIEISDKINATIVKL
ncbi:MAG: metallophosphoesterase family protein [Candidatus Omnitrophota bacterium]